MSDTVNPYVHRVNVGEMDKQGAFSSVIADRDVYFGDGGRASLDFPLVVCPRLPMPTSATLRELAAELARVAAARRDVQQNAVVEDIVDPELFPRLLPPGERVRHEPIDQHSLAKAALINSAIRGSYVWVPSQVRFDGKRATFASPIHNLPRTRANERLYVLLEAALSAMMPSLIEKGAQPCSTGNSSGDKAKRYQIAVKLQRYVVPPDASYTGQWHTEGVTEGVSAVGVLYVEWPEELTGGALKFRPRSVPDDSYREYIDDVKLNVAVEVREGSALVFENTIPHRFETLTNSTSKPLVRSFVNFFATSPDLLTTAEVPTNADIYLALIGKLNYDVIGEVLAWLQTTPPTWSAALDLRARAKAEMVAHRGRWGYIHYGNCGQVEWLATGGPSQQEVAVRNERRKILQQEYGYSDYDSIPSDVQVKFVKEYPHLATEVHHVDTYMWREMAIRSRCDDSQGSGPQSDSHRLADN